MKALVAAVLGLALSTAPALAQGKKSQAPEVDYSDAPICSAVPELGATEICRCEDGPTSGSVWGSGPYTADSSICTAARHSGVIGADGGALELAGRPGQDSYAGTEANGVVTSSWGSYNHSFTVDTVPMVVAVLTPDLAGTPVCSAVPDEGATLVCRCDGGMMSGSVWGSGPYTGDSAICAAALHSGVITAAGGAVSLIDLPGQSSYAGSQANGVTTSSWGSYGSSFGVRMASASAGPVCDVIPGDVDQHTCSCTDDIGGSVWGSGPYTADSNICTAARHAGYIEAGGGEVMVLRVQGLSEYGGTESNGETSSSWGSYDSSIVFNWN